MSLPKIPSRVKLSQLQVLDKQGANSRAALTFKHLSNMDHQHLVAIRGYIKQDLKKRSFVPEMAKYDSKNDLRASQSNPLLPVQGVDAITSSKPTSVQD